MATRAKSKSWNPKMTFDEMLKSKATYPPVRTLRDMTEEEIVAIEEQYGVPVIRPPKD